MPHALLHLVQALLIAEEAMMLLLYIFLALLQYKSTTEATGALYTILY